MFIIQVFLFTICSFVLFLAAYNHYYMQNGIVTKRGAGLLVFRRFDSQIEYLLLKASKGSPPKHWSPPKGHMDPGEDDFTAALRETREEAGYTADDLNIYKNEQKTINYNGNGKHKIVTFWLAELEDPKKVPTLSKEHTEFKWLPKDDATSLVGNSNFTDIVTYFHDKIEKL
ncbi:bis(5'-nucleosyl)-tetraphosphatase [asymmetrical]-like [Sitodiplosis mosellana]|uniref:bis(5'-nucleosyl)-tetraphosphatase [asymmetrical]-like n=1 Tax=Sitodiplosis mosellana TaxID=263140 RepID=UPI002444C4A6|nr:bis(5'-nucleosyl)-tetraphosphatase [asymmetrical]-like [Sitodiplosis mosellana]